MAVLASSHFKFEVSPTGRFIENITASTAQLEPEQKPTKPKIG